MAVSPHPKPVPDASKYSAVNVASNVFGGEGTNDGVGFITTSTTRADKVGCLKIGTGCEMFRTSNLAVIRKGRNQNHGIGIDDFHCTEINADDVGCTSIACCRCNDPCIGIIGRLDILSISSIRSSHPLSIPSHVSSKPGALSSLESSQFTSAHPVSIEVDTIQRLIVAIIIHTVALNFRGSWIDFRVVVDAIFAEEAHLHLHRKSLRWSHHSPRQIPSHVTSA